jgi:hypothetical protein
MFKTLKNGHAKFNRVPKELYPFVNALYEALENSDKGHDEETEEDDDCDMIELPLELLPVAFIDHELRIHEIERILEKAKLTS